VPLSVELSVDGKAFHSIARDEKLFDEWTVHVPEGAKARYVRLVHGSALYFHLAEIEVY
jgi:hypothetical protein